MVVGVQQIGPSSLESQTVIADIEFAAHNTALSNIAFALNRRSQNRRIGWPRFANDERYLPGLIREATGIEFH